VLVSPVGYYFAAKAMHVDEISQTGELVRMQFQRTVRSRRKSTPSKGE
jgi:hypothetical protein